MTGGTLARRSAARLGWPIASRRAPWPGAAQFIGRHLPELGWAIFATGCCVTMIVWPPWEMVPFHLLWISLTVLYAFRVWSLRPTLVLLAATMAITAATIAVDTRHGLHLRRELSEVPLMAVLFLAIIWLARHRVDALKMAEDRAERQERFIHDASHELRTPATIARGHLELLRSRGIDANELGVALDELTRVDEILERLLLLATADQPDFVQPVPVELESLLEDTFLRWAEMAPRSWCLGELVQGRLRVDPGRLRAALDALIENAVKYSPPGARIELRARYAWAGWVSIEVEDEGYGIPDEAFARIFDRFSRADPARTRAAGGVGLGLAIVDAIAKAHGGECRLTSTPRGSTFSLRLPGFTPVFVKPPPRSYR